jgi:hypothetical protein
MATDDTEARLDAIREREQAATAGPWVIWSPGYDNAGRNMWSLGNAAEPRNHPVADFGSLGEPDLADQAFIIAAREDVPWLAAELERVTAALRGWEARDHDGEPPHNIERGTIAGGDWEVLVEGLTGEQADKIEAFIAALAGGARAAQEGK